MGDRLLLYVNHYVYYSKEEDWTINRIYKWKVDAGRVLDSHHYISFSNSLGIL